MPLQFLRIYELFEQLSSSRKPHKHNKVTETWFQQHGSDIPRQGSGALALLSCLFPEKRPDRVYGLREGRLEGIVVKAAQVTHVPPTYGVYKCMKEWISPLLYNKSFQRHQMMTKNPFTR